MTKYVCSDIVSVYDVYLAVFLYNKAIVAMIVWYM